MVLRDRGPEDRGPEDRGPEDRGPEDHGPNETIFPRDQVFGTDQLYHGFLNHGPTLILYSKHLSLLRSLYLAIKLCLNTNGK